MGESFFFVLRDSLPLDQYSRNPGSDHFAKLGIGEMNVQNRGIYPQIRRGDFTKSSLCKGKLGDLSRTTGRGLRLVSHFPGFRSI